MLVSGRVYIYIFDLIFLSLSKYIYIYRYELSGSKELNAAKVFILHNVADFLVENPSLASRYQALSLAYRGNPCPKGFLEQSITIFNHPLHEHFPVVIHHWSFFVFNFGFHNSVVVHHSKYVYY